MFEVPITTLNERSLEGLELTSKQKDRCKNFFALGPDLLAVRALDGPDAQVDRPEVRQPAGHRRRRTPRALKAGYNYGETTELFHTTVPGAQGEARARACIARSPATRRPRSACSRRRSWPSETLFYGCYPITPASDILHELSGYKNFGVLTFQAEDEIAAIGAAIGAAFGGALAVTGTSRARHRAEGGGDRPGGDDRAAAGHHRRPARRTAHRPADQDRAGRPAPGAVRPQRRVPDAGHRAARRPADCFTLAIEACAHRHSST